MADGGVWETGEEVRVENACVGVARRTGLLEEMEEQNCSVSRATRMY